MTALHCSSVMHSPGALSGVDIGDSKTTKRWIELVDRQSIIGHLQWFVRQTNVAIWFTRSFSFEVFHSKLSNRSFYSKIFTLSFESVPCQEASTHKAIHRIQWIQWIQRNVIQTFWTHLTATVMIRHRMASAVLPGSLSVTFAFSARKLALIYSW